MGLFERFPYTNFHELNCTWIIEELIRLKTTIEQFVSINALKYADPIQWNIIRQYEKNTIVIDPLTGTAYISVQPVPSGVAITNTDYWTVVFDLGSFVVRAAKNFTDKYEEETTLTATFPSSVNEWLIWGDTLYRVVSPITAGDQYIDGSNIIHFTIEDAVGHIQDLTTTDKSNLVAAINELVQSLINEASRVDGITGDPSDLTTTDKSNLVAAINEVLQDITDEATRVNNMVGSLTDLETVEKSDVVSAINELVKDNIVGLTGYQIDDAFLYQIDFSNITGSTTFNGMQGGCYNPVRNTFVIGFLEGGNEANGVLVELQEDLTTVVQRVFYPNGELRHCNDMTYNTLTDKIYIAGYTTGSTNNSIIEVNPIDLSIIQDHTFAPGIDSGHTIAKISYDAENDRYVTMSNYDIMIIDAAFNLVSTTPFTWANFVMNKSGTVTFSPLQSIQIYQDKIFALYTVMNGNSGSSSVVIYDYDGNIQASFPVYCGIITLESECITLYKGMLKIFIGGNLGFFSTNFNISNVPYSNIGSDPYQLGVMLDSGSLDDIYKSGCYYILTPANVGNSPFEDSYSIYSLPNATGYTQIAVKASGKNFIAIRRSNYIGTWNSWEYYPKLLVQPNRTYTTMDDIVPAQLSSSGSQIAYYVDCGIFEQGVAASDITVSAFSFWSATANGTMNITNSDNYIVSKAFVGNKLQLVISKNDASTYGSGNFGTPVIGLGHITFSVS